MLLLLTASLVLCSIFLSTTPDDQTKPQSGYMRSACSSSEISSRVLINVSSPSPRRPQTKEFGEEVKFQIQNEKTFDTRRSFGDTSPRRILYSKNLVKSNQKEVTGIELEIQKSTLSTLNFLLVFLFHSLCPFSKLEKDHKEEVWDTTKMAN